MVRKALWPVFRRPLECVVFGPYDVAVRHTVLGPSMDGLDSCAENVRRKQIGTYIGRRRNRVARSLSPIFDKSRHGGYTASTFLWQSGRYL